jgi:hypothetical protein
MSGPTSRRSARDRVTETCRWLIPNRAAQKTERTRTSVIRPSPNPYPRQVSLRDGAHGGVQSVDTSRGAGLPRRRRRTRVTPRSASDTARDSAGASDTHRHSPVRRPCSVPACAPPVPTENSVRVVAFEVNGVWLISCDPYASHPGCCARRRSLQCPSSRRTRSRDSCPASPARRAPTGWAFSYRCQRFVCG